MSRTTLASFLKHPLVLLILGGVFSALLIPQVTREWQDRQREQEIKRDLLEQIATSATTAIRQGNSLVMACTERSGELSTPKPKRSVCAPLPPNHQVRAAGGEPGEEISEIYAVLKDSWLIRRSIPRSTIITYFPKTYSCWYSYERALADYLGLVTQSANAKKVRVDALGEFVRADMTAVYGQSDIVERDCAHLRELPENVEARYRQLKKLMGWTALTYPTWHFRFKQEYAKLGEILGIAMERIIVTIDAADAKGFSQGFDIP